MTVADIPIQEIAMAAGYLVAFALGVIGGLQR